MKLLLHPTIESTISAFKRNLPQGVLFSGDSGVGLRTIAQSLAAGQLEVILYPTDKDNEVDHIYGSISIEKVRQIYDQTRGKSTHDRVIIIDDIDRMTLPAQNAFLKLLEEPPTGVHFIVTTHFLSAILPTIRSRLQTVHVPHISREQSNQQLLLEKKQPSNAPQLLFMAMGKPAEMRRLLDSAKYLSEQQHKFTTARNFVGGTPYQQIITVQAIKNRNEALQFIDSSIAIIRATLLKTAHQSLVARLDTLIVTREHIAMNGNIKLQLLRACLPA